MTAPAVAEGRLAGAGGGRIFWQSWSPPEGEPRAVVLVAHGWADHGGRYGRLAERLVDEGYAVYAIDHQGHGRSEGPRARVVLAQTVADLDRVRDTILARFEGTPLFLLGHSMGGAIALRYAIAHQDRLAGLILTGPLARVDGHGAAKALGRVVGRLLPGLPLAKIDTALISRDPAVVSAYVSDPLVYHGGIPAGTVAQLLEHVSTLPVDAGAITLPVLVMYGTADGLCAPSGSVMLGERLGSAEVTVTPFAGLYHEILNEPERAQVLDQLCGWLAERVPARAAQL